MGIGQNISDFFSASAALGRTAFGTSKGRVSTMRFAEKHGDKNDPQNYGAFHWLEALESNVVRVLDSSEEIPLYVIYQCRLNFGKAPQKPTQKNGRVEITIDGEKIFTFPQAMDILKSWEEEAKANPELVTPSASQPLRSLHYSRHQKIR